VITITPEQKRGGSKPFSSFGSGAGGDGVFEVQNNVLFRSGAYWARKKGRSVRKGKSRQKQPTPGINDGAGRRIRSSLTKIEGSKSPGGGGIFNVTNRIQLN